jgi:hypothetical protein
MPVPLSVNIGAAPVVAKLIPATTIVAVVPCAPDDGVMLINCGDGLGAVGVGPSLHEVAASKRRRKNAARHIFMRRYYKMRHRENLYG